MIRPGDSTINPRLYALARLLLAYGTPDGVLKRFLQALCEDLSAGAGYLVVRRESGFEPVASVRYQLDDEAELNFSSTAVRHVLRQQRPMLVEDVRFTPWLNTAQSVAITGLRSLACVPIIVQHRPLAVLYVERRGKQTPFPPDTLQFLTEAADLCAGVLARRLDSERSRNPEWIPTDQALQLTPQEERVAEFLKLGHTNRQIAEQMGISHETVKAHLQHLYGKLGVRSRSAAAYRLSKRDRDVD